MEWVKRTMCGYRGMWHCKTLLWLKKKERAKLWGSGKQWHAESRGWGSRKVSRGKGQWEAGTDIREEHSSAGQRRRRVIHIQCRSSPKLPAESRLKASTRETPSVQCLGLRLAAPSPHRSLGKIPSQFHPHLCELRSVNPASAGTLTRVREKVRRPGGKL